DNADAQFEANKLGVWIFLVTEILLFGGLFVAFAVFRAWHLPAFVEAHHHLDKVMGAVNTVVLICSSLTMALGVRAAQRSKTRQTAAFLALTLAFAATFLVIKAFEYQHKLHEGLLPGAYFTAQGFTYPAAKIFFGLYFMMTGIHGLHVVIGMGLITWVLVRSLRGQFSSRYYSPVESVGLYWHLVDLIWIYLFPLLYLVG
ncbi:MAG: cytochrome c oxidase subunit 3 family protein, partial [Deltaproteobacteria bacterium]|nr:cytochrome c oxidase subunit 3 family protein [Deltaproteobacteria bacterium]